MGRQSTRNRKKQRQEDAVIHGKALKDLKKLLGDEYTVEDGVRMMALLQGKHPKTASTPHPASARREKQADLADPDMMDKELLELKETLGDKYRPEDGLELVARLEEKLRNQKFHKGMRPVNVDLLFPSRSAKRARKKRLQELCYKLAEKKTVKMSLKNADAFRLDMSVSGHSITT